LAFRKLSLSEHGAEALKHVGALVKYFNIYVCAFVGMNNKVLFFFYIVPALEPLSGIIPGTANNNKQKAVTLLHL